MKVGIKSAIVSKRNLMANPSTIMNVWKPVISSNCICVAVTLIDIVLKIYLSMICYLWKNVNTFKKKKVD